MNRKDKIVEIIRRLKKTYSEAPGTALRHSSPFELLAATILSAQTTDIQVNRVTETLFKKYGTISAYADVSPEALARDVSSINFYRTKAKNIVASAKLIMGKFNGEVPKTMDGLVSLPGVARKTANIVLSNAFGINEGIAVDTHVRRLANRLGLAASDDPVRIERELMAVTPGKEWGNLSHLLILHGRSVCRAKKPAHDECVLYDLCPSKKI